MALLIQLVERLTGTLYSSEDRRQHLLTSTKALMSELKANSMTELLQRISVDSADFQKFVSAITIHTTSWFREPDQFNKFEKLIREKSAGGQKKFRIWCAACSTGQEAFTLAMVLENLKSELPEIDYQIEASDIDSLSVGTAQRAVYSKEQSSQIPQNFQKYVLWSKCQNYFKIDKALTNRVKFRVLNVDQDFPVEFVDSFDVVFCRNLLIYFHPRKVSLLILRILRLVRNEGSLFLASSEALFQKIHGLESSGGSVYRKTLKAGGAGDLKAQAVSQILVVDDSAVERKLIGAILSRSGFKVFTAENAALAAAILKQESIDLITLDLEMPGKHGAVWLREIRSLGYQMPVIVISSCDPADAQVGFGALDRGAQDFFDKAGLHENSKNLLETVQALLNPQLSSDFFVVPKERPQFMNAARPPDLILIGASTGGPEAIWQLLRQFPKPTPPILIVQHTNEFFATHFGQSVGKSSGLLVSTMKEAEPLVQNMLYIAQGDYHIGVTEKEGRFVLARLQTPSENGHRPAVDVLFRSVAQTRATSIALVMTGMGKDGCSGAMDLYKSTRSWVMAQSADSCVVFGMPREVIQARCVHEVGDLLGLRRRLIEACAPKTARETWSLKKSS
ncbi:MAG: chemotaxis protein CheB [Bdellovibrio sp.]